MMVGETKRERHCVPGLEKNDRGRFSLGWLRTGGGKSFSRKVR